MEDFIKKNHASLETREELQKMDKNDLRISSDFNSLNPSAQAYNYSTRLAIETAYPFQR